MTYESYVKRTMQIVGMKLNSLFDEYPHLINFLYRSLNHLLIRKYSNIPFAI